MARIARRSLRLRGVPLFSLQNPWEQIADSNGRLPLNLFEPRYVELARRIEPPAGSGKFGYTAVSDRHRGGRGTLVEAKHITWRQGQGNVILVASALQRFRVLAVRGEQVAKGRDPLHVAHVQLLAERDLARMRCDARGGGSSDGDVSAPEAIVKQLAPGEPAPPATIFGQAYVQHGMWGFASYHFDGEAEGESYISYENNMCAAFPPLESGARPPTRVPFRKPCYDPRTRTFRGSVSWAPTTWWGVERWEYRMVFAPDFSAITGGSLHCYRPEDTRQHSKSFVFGADLQYKRWMPAEENPEDVVRAALLRTGISPVEISTALQGAGPSTRRARVLRKRVKKL